MANFWIKNPMAIYTGNDLDARGGIVISNGKIIELVPNNQRPNSQIDHFFDASNLVITPGLINSHHHFYQTLTRAWAPVVNVPLFPWLKTLYPVWAKLSPEQLHLATQIALSELVLSGCTFAADHHYLFPAQLTDAIDIQVDAAKSLGMRVMLTRGSMSLGEKSGGLPPEHTIQDMDIILKDSERLVNKYHERSSDAMVNIALAPCSPFSVSQEIMQQSAQLAEHLDVRLHTHLAETIDEENFCVEKFGMRTVDYLESVGWLNSRTWLAHGIHFNAEEIQRLGQAKVGICHCPHSNMRLASGICPTLDLMENGAIVGLGVDGSASGDASNLILEARQAMYLQRLKYGAERITPELALNWATVGSAQLLGRAQHLGQIAPDYQADFAFYKLDDIKFSGSHDPISALLLCGADRAEHVMIQGQWIVKDGDLQTIDLDKLQFEHRLAAKKLLAA
ncbi:8-oxoguanine deaminase [Acinetobacter shaoyimingii]|uniref:8-oxoguanine deaminase n=1 Tax=Acinetobacter shaoyimingii TaxID=2715164 RepID=A0A6G8RV12_9GAMM|nr:8-oxoguanine deaminase [Acinetobacter shaoyimingii]QIO05628.1 8-oxoguanine deaminase [Acinetobacter shaoyimingii]